MRYEEDKMAITERKVVLCKSKADADGGEIDYKTTLESAGFTCVHIPVLRFEFINLEELRARLLLPQSYSGLILTSPRSVEAVQLAIRAKETDVLGTFWSDLPAYCVGPSTEQLARKQLGLRSCWGSETGNAEELAKLIVAEARPKTNDSEAKPLLYPCSLIARDSIASALRSAGITYEKLPVYQTLSSETLQRDLNESFSDFQPEFLVLFSPSGVKHVVNAMRLNLKEDTLKRIKIVAIGPVTRQALAEAGLEVYATSDKPDPKALLQAVNKIPSS